MKNGRTLGKNQKKYFDLNFDFRQTSKYQSLATFLTFEHNFVFSLVKIQNLPQKNVVKVRNIYCQRPKKRRENNYA